MEDNLNTVSITRSKSLENFKKRKNNMSEMFDTDQDDMVVMSGSANNGTDMKEMYDKMNQEYKTFNKTLTKFMENSHKNSPSNGKSSHNEEHFKKYNIKNKTERNTFEELNESLTEPYRRENKYDPRNIYGKDLRLNFIGDYHSPTTEDTGFYRRNHRLRSADDEYELSNNGTTGTKSPRFYEDSKL